MNPYLSCGLEWPKLTGTDTEVSVATRVRWRLVKEAEEWLTGGITANLILPTCDGPVAVPQTYGQFDLLFVVAAERFVRENLSAVAWLSIAPGSLADHILQTSSLEDGWTLGEVLDVLTGTRQHQGQ
jgi:hypothetical protein